MKLFSKNPVKPAVSAASPLVAFPSANFPLLAAQDIAYLDNGATTQKPTVVLDAMDQYYRTANANVHRGVYKLADTSTQAYEDARNVVAKYLDVHDDEVIFTSGATHSLNLAAHILSKHVKPGDEILTTIAEHHALFVPFQQLALRTGATFVVVPLTDEQSITVAQINKYVSSKTCIIAVSAMSNVLGYALDTSKITKGSARLVVDAAQSIRHTKHYPNADFVAFSAHKIFGPQGVGVLQSRRELLKDGEPLITGGAMIQTVSEIKSTWTVAPARFEAGTPNVAGAVGLAAAIKFYEPLRKNAHEAEMALTHKAQAIVAKYCNIIGPEIKDGPIISFTMKDAHAHDIAQALDAYGVCVRAGHHCCQPLHAVLKVDASVRLSIAFYNTERDLERLEAGLKSVEELFS